MKKKRKSDRKRTRIQVKKQANGFQKATPSVLAWARKRTDEKEIVDGLKDIKKTGGLTLKDFWTELQEAAKPR